MSLTPQVDAHARWLLDGIVKPRNDAVGLKEPAPCGGIPRGGENPAAPRAPAVFTAGQAITVQWDEPIDHPGYFIISFSSVADAGFDQNVLVPRIPGDADGAEVAVYGASIILPNEPCNDCTLQLIQVMEDQDPPTNYYSCADIVLMPAGAPGGDPNDITPPADVAGVSAAPGDTQVYLTWANPPADFFQALILQSDEVVDATPVTDAQYAVNETVGNATVIYSGNNSSLTHGQLTNGNEYHFRLIAFDAGLNYAPGVATSASLPANPANEAPTVSLLVEQATRDIDERISLSDGPVIVQANASDPNPANQHRHDWGATDARLTDLDGSDTSFTFDPANLAPGDYEITVTVTDNGNPALSGSNSTTLTAVQSAGAGPPPTPTPAPTAGMGGSSGGGGSIGWLSLLAMLLVALLFGLRTKTDTHSHRRR